MIMRSGGGGRVVCMECQPVVLFSFVSFVLLLIVFVNILCCAPLRDYCVVVYVGKLLVSFACIFENRF